jgi:hypothetical protein
VKQVVVIR